MKNKKEYDYKVVYVDKETHKKLKLKAVENDMSIKDIIEKIVNQ